MSSKLKGRKSEKTAQPRESRIVIARPTGKVPVAVVSARHGGDVKSRPGRGFSIGELRGAGLARGLVTRWGAVVDLRRRSILENNVASLKSWGAHAAPAPESRTGKLKEEIGKVERTVRKEATQLEKEVVEVEKEVKRDAGKAEKAVKAKVVKARAKPKKKAKE